MGDKKYRRDTLFAGYVIDNNFYIIKHAIAFQDRNGNYYDLDVNKSGDEVKSCMPCVDKNNINFGDSLFALSELVPLFPIGDSRSVSFSTLMKSKEDLFVMALTRNSNEKYSVPTTFEKFIEFLAENIKSVGAKKENENVRKR